MVTPEATPNDQCDGWGGGLTLRSQKSNIQPSWVSSNPPQFLFWYPGKCCIDHPAPYVTPRLSEATKLEPPSFNVYSH